MIKNVFKNLSKNLSGNYRKKHLDHPKKSAADAFKNSSKIVFRKTAEATGDLIDNNNLLIKLWGFQKLHNKII